MNNTLPKGWISIELGHLGNYINGRAFKPSEWKTNGIPIIRIQNLNNPNATYNYSNIKHEDKYKVYHDDLLMAWSASLGVFIWHGNEAWLNQHIFRVEPNEKIVTKKFLFYALKEAIEEFYQKSHGSGIVHITKPVFEAHKIPLPPLPEQHRIVEKLDTLMARIASSKARLERIPTILKNFRQSVLAAAVSGELTKEWREENKEAENGLRLLTKIKYERLKYLKKEKIYKTSSEIESPDLPDKWSWGNWSDYLDYSDDPFKRGPFGSALKKEIFVSKGYKVYEQYCPINDDCSFARYYITKEKFNELKKFAVKAGDFLISCSGVTLGRITEVPTKFDEGVINQAILRVRINKAFIDASFFKLLFRSPYFQKNIFENSTGSAIPNVKGVDELKAIPLPVLTLEEQKEIVRKVEELFHFADSIEARYQKAKAWFDKLPQSLLAKAFRGELVPQNEKDEPAAELLKRIQSEKQGKTAKATKATRPAKGNKTYKMNRDEVLTAAAEE